MLDLSQSNHLNQSLADWIFLNDQILIRYQLTSQDLTRLTPFLSKCPAPHTHTHTQNYNHRPLPCPNRQTQQRLFINDSFKITFSMNIYIFALLTFLWRNLFVYKRDRTTFIYLNIVQINYLYPFIYIQYLSILYVST